MDEGVGNSILCPESDCDVIIDDETVIELVNNLQVKHRYQHFITNSFVQVRNYASEFYKFDHFMLHFLQ